MQDISIPKVTYIGRTSGKNVGRIARKLNICSVLIKYSVSDLIIVYFCGRERTK